MIRQAEAQRESGEMEALQARVKELEREIERGTTNLLLADPDNVPLLSQALTQRRKDRDHALARLAELDAAITDIEEEVKQAEAMLWNLREVLGSEDAEQLRAVLHEVVEKVEVKLLRGSRRGRSRSWESGVIWLRRRGEPSSLGTSDSSNHPHGGASSRATGCPPPWRGPG
jgi:hypothetical protein